MNRALGAAILLAATARSASGLSAAPEQLTRDVQAIFRAKCVECHGPALAHPKAHFGYVLDLARVAANRHMIIPGDPDRSELYQLVLDDEMPGEHATVAALTAEEKLTVKSWIEAGAPAPPAAMETRPAKPPLSFGARCLRAIGLFHPPSSHFPIALLIAALPAELMWKRTRKRSWKATVRFCVTAGAGCAVATAALGWCDAWFSNYTGDSAPVLFWHRWVGTATALLASATAIVSEFSHRESRPRILRHLFRALLLACVLAVALAGYLGASLIYGLDHFRW